MIGLDTNILLRYQLQDDPSQAPVVNRFFEQELRPDNPGYVSLAASLEIVWVLRSVWKLKPREIAASLRELLAHDSLRFQNELEVAAAVSALQQGAGEFEDILIGALNQWSGCTESVTFDQKAARLPYFRLLV
jgi:predicted nucleic-acid-binding protein